MQFDFMPDPALVEEPALLPLASPAQPEDPGTALVRAFAEWNAPGATHYFIDFFHVYPEGYCLEDCVLLTPEIIAVGQAHHEGG